MRLIVIIFFFFTIKVCLNDIKAEDNNKSNTLKIGNFSLKESQQPGPLLGLGEHVIDKGQIQFFLLTAALTGKNNYKTEIVPTIVYGITNKLAILFETPFSPRSKEGINKSSGMEDMLLELEYAFYVKSNKYSTDQATIVSNVTFPTGSIHKNPKTGFGSPSFLLGLTYDHTTATWLYFGATGITLTTKHDSFKPGNQFLYQAGIGKNICTPPGWIYAWIVEFIGLYSWKDSVNNRKDPNSGGNQIFIIPSLWASSEKLILQLGIGSPIQHLFGNQFKQHLFLNFNFGWTFK